jgi:cytochrome c-type biogenesis protein CcmH/NrfG
MIRKEYSTSIPLFQEAIGRDASNGGAFIGLGFAYLHSGRYGPARAAMVEAQSLLPQRAAEIQQVISWIDDRTMPDTEDGLSASNHLPKTVKAAVAHTKHEQ